MIRNDLRFGARLLARNPVFTASAVLLLAIGIGANTLIFSAVDALLLRRLPVRHPEQLVRLVEVHPTGFLTWDLPPDWYEPLAANTRTLTDVLCQGDLDVALEDHGTVERVRANAVSGNFFTALGINAALGRVLRADDDRRILMVAVLSHDFWQRRFRGDRAVLGHALRLNGHVLMVVGVLPEEINGLTVDTTPDIRLPLSAGKIVWQGAHVEAEDTMALQIFGRLRPGTTMQHANAEIDPLIWRIQKRIAAAHGRSAAPPEDVFQSRIAVEQAGNGISLLRSQFSTGLILMMTAVALLLLMACANVACLLLARSAARLQEMTIRLSLGAGRWRIARQLLTESLLLALAGGAAGIGLTWACRPLLVAALPPIRDRDAVLQPLAVHIDVDARELAFALAASLITALLFGLSPALRGARHDLAEYLRGSRTSTARASGQNVLVGIQVALCVMLLAGSGLLVNTFDHMRNMNPGFDRDHVVTFTIDPALKGYTANQAQALSRNLLMGVRALPGVSAAAIAGRGLMRGTGLKTTVGPAGRPLRRGDFLNASINSVTPGYFGTMGMRLLEGRDFNWFDRNRQKPARVIVNEAFVQRFFPGSDPLGRFFGNAGPDGLAAADNQILGVVSDAKYRSLREPIPPIIYHPRVDGFDDEFILHVGTATDPAALIGPVRQLLKSLAPGLPWVEARTLRDEVQASLWQERLLAWLSTLFSCFAAVLAGIGLYGALDLAVKGRTREIGIRVALGAAPLRVARLLSGGMLAVVSAGVVAGLGAYAASAHWLRQVVYGVSPSGVVAPASALVLISAIAVLAAAIPIRRAIRTDPAAALRHE